jgi:hypothetical protein
MIFLLTMHSDLQKSLGRCCVQVRSGELMVIHRCEILEFMMIWVYLGLQCSLALACTHFYAGVKLSWTPPDMQCVLTKTYHVYSEIQCPSLHRWLNVAFITRNSL